MSYSAYLYVSLQQGRSYGPGWLWVQFYGAVTVENNSPREHTSPAFLVFANVFIFFIILICLTFFCSIFGLLTSAVLRSDFCLGHFYMLEESCNLLLGSIYTSLYPRISNSAKCIGEFSDLICGVNMSLLIQINSADQITFSSPSSLSSAVTQTGADIPKHLAAWRRFPLN